MINELKSRCARMWQHRKNWKALVQNELERGRPVGLRLRLKSYRRGFTSQSWEIYQLGNKTDLEIRDYLSDVARFVYTPHINGPFGYLVDNKLAFWEIMGPEKHLLPEHHALLQRFRVIPLSDALESPTRPGVVALIRKLGAVFIKPMDGGATLGVSLLEFRDGAFLKDREPLSESELERYLFRCQKHLVMENLEQADYVAEIFPETSNAIRILTMWDVETREPFVATAVQRFGIANTIPHDRFGTGGLSTRIDLETGVLGDSIQAPFTERTLRVMDRHPESGRMIKGVQVPFWRESVALALRLARRFEYLPYLGWDFLITNDGPRIIETNKFSGMDVLQVHGPLLKDPRVRAFFKNRAALRLL